MSWEDLEYNRQPRPPVNHSAPIRFEPKLSWLQRLMAYLCR